MVVLEHPDLAILAAELQAHGLRVSLFHEPDLDDQLTALSAEPAAWRRLSNVKLAG